MTKKKTSVKAPEAVERDYVLPELGIVVKATSVEEAVKKANKVKENDGE